MHKNAKTPSRGAKMLKKWRLMVGDLRWKSGEGMRKKEGKERNENGGEKEKLREPLFQIAPPPPRLSLACNQPIM